MPKIKKPPPYFMKHLVDRFRDGRISVADFDALHGWLSSNPDVPHGKWYKTFPNFILAAKAKFPRRFSSPAWRLTARKSRNSARGSLTL
jgi:hypothetical protein